MNSLQQLNEQGQSPWYDNISRGLIESGGLQKLIDLGITGLTSNPTIFEKAISSGSDYDDSLVELARAGKSIFEIYDALSIEDIQAAADMLRPVYDRTGGADGFASLEVNPHLAHDTEKTIAEAERLVTAVDRPNLLVKVPGTPEGVPAFQAVIGEGISVNVTLLFSLEAYRTVREAYLAGLEHLDASGGDVGKIASVASFFVSRVDTTTDERLGEGSPLAGKAAIANARLAYRDFQTDFRSDRFEALRAKGAKVQRPLWASTSTKNPAYRDVMYVEDLIGPDTVDTMPQVTVDAVLDHGEIARTLDQHVDQAQRDIEAIESAGVSMKDVTDHVLADGVRLFSESFDGLLANIEEKVARLQEPVQADD